MKIGKLIQSSVATLTLSLLSSFAMAVPVPVISIQDPIETGLVGELITVDLVWDGSVAPYYIGDFDIDIAFDSSIVSYDSAVFDPAYGLDSFGGIFGDTGSAGSVNLYGLSWDFLSDLKANQNSLGNTFILASITFEALADGETDLVLSANAIGNEYGDDFSYQFNDGKICVGANGCAQAQVPEPSSMGLVILGAVGLIAGRRKLAKA